MARLPQGEAEARRLAAERAGALVKDGLVELRRAVRALRPGALETFSLPEALAELLAGSRETTGIHAIWQHEGQTAILPPALGVPLYRAAQEALTNVSRHASASRVVMTLVFGPEDIVLRVEDDGRGGEVKHGYGLRGLQERAEALGGQLSAGPGSERGFCVELKLPRRQ